jgi:hypothetical protein
MAATSSDAVPSSPSRPYTRFDALAFQWDTRQPSEPTVTYIGGLSTGTFLGKNPAVTNPEHGLIPAAKSSGKEKGRV